MKALSPKPIEKISQIEDRVTGHPRNRSREDTGLPIATVEHRTLVTGVQTTIWREQGDEESLAFKSSKSSQQ